MATLGAMVKQELKELKNFKPPECVVCGETRQSPRYQTEAGIVCRACYHQAIKLGMAILLKKEARR